MAQHIKTKRLFQDPRVTMKASEDPSMIIAEWKDECKNLLRGQSLSSLDKVNQVLEEHAPEKVLIDFSECGYSFDPENQEWKHNLLFTKINYDQASRMAFVVPGNLFVYPSFEATRATLENEISNIQYFKDKDKALAWLMEK
mgnify:CR=1 FL=1